MINGFLKRCGNGKECPEVNVSASVSLAPMPNFFNKRLSPLPFSTYIIRL